MSSLSRRGVHVAFCILYRDKITEVQSGVFEVSLTDAQKHKPGPVAIAKPNAHQPPLMAWKSSVGFLFSARVS